EPQRTAVRREHQPGGDLVEQARQDPSLLAGRVDCPAAVGGVAPQLLEGGYLRLVEDVVDARVGVVDPYLGELVDREVAEWVCDRRAWTRRDGNPHRAGERGEADSNPTPTHWRASRARRARGAYRGLKRGLCSNKAPSIWRARPACPARRAIMPAWYRKEGSRDPSRIASRENLAAGAIRPAAYSAHAYAS